MGECNCGPDLVTTLLIALGLIAGVIGTVIVTASLGSNIVRLVRFLRANTVRLFVPMPREPREPKPPRDRPSLWAAIWAVVLLAILVSVIAAGLITIGTAP